MSLIIAGVILLLLFTATWWLSVKLDNYSLVDVTWALSFTPVALWYAASADGWIIRRAMVCGLVAAWSLRLGLYLWRRVASHHPAEDARYAVLRKRWAGSLRQSFLAFFMAQAVLVWLLMLPVWLIVRRSEQGFDALEIIGFTVWAAALIGEGIADSQLARFKRSSPGPERVCDAGLWRYSRHPNYFFQSFLWWGLFLMALPAAWGWTSIVAPLSMLHFLLNVTGIPLTEKLAVEKRGDAYREYQRTTSAFVPWLHRKPGKNASLSAPSHGE